MMTVAFNMFRSIPNSLFFFCWLLIDVDHISDSHTFISSFQFTYIQSVIV